MVCSTKDQSMSSGRSPVTAGVPDIAHCRGKRGGRERGGVIGERERSARVSGETIDRLFLFFFSSLEVSLSLAFYYALSHSSPF